MVEAEALMLFFNTHFSVRKFNVCLLLGINNCNASAEIPPCKDIVPEELGINRWLT